MHYHRRDNATITTDSGPSLTARLTLLAIIAGVLIMAMIGLGVWHLTIRANRSARHDDDDSDYETVPMDVFANLGLVPPPRAYVRRS
jgi:hypothetical protein